MEHLIGKAKLADVMIEPRRGYVSYLLRLWQVNIKGETVWRASIKSRLGRAGCQYPGDARRAIGLVSALASWLRRCA